MFAWSKPKIVEIRRCEMDDSELCTVRGGIADTGDGFKAKLSKKVIQYNLQSTSQSDMNYFKNFPLGIFLDLHKACEQKFAQLQARTSKITPFESMALFTIMANFTITTKHTNRMRPTDMIYTRSDLQNAFRAIFAVDLELSDFIEKDPKNILLVFPKTDSVVENVKKISKKRHRFLKELYRMVSKIRQERADKIDKITKELFSDESDSIASDGERE